MGLFSFKKQQQSMQDFTMPESVLPDDIYKASTLKLKDILAPSALQITPRELNLGEKIARMFYVISYPRYLTDNWFSPIVNLDRVFDVSIFIHPVDTSMVLKKFQKKVAEVQSQIHQRESQGIVRDPMLDAAYENLETLRDSLQQAQERLFDVGVYISVYADTKEELSAVEGEIKNILDSQMIYIRPALFQQDQAYRSILPMATDELMVVNKLNTAPLSSIFPFVSFDLTTEKGILYGVNMHNNSLVLFDRYSMENYNSVLFAKSGSGKSYTTKLEVLRSLMFDTEVIVIDPEREYEYMASATGGRYFNISLSSGHHINPFDLPPVREDEQPSEILRQNIITLVGLFRIILSGLTPEEDAIIDRAVTETYALKDITGNTDFSNMTPPLLSDFEMVLGGMEGSESLLRRLSKYISGTWSGFINKPTNVDINHKFVVFSVRDMEEELKPAAMYIVTNYIWTSVRRELKKRLMVVDEAWWMMKSDDTASFLYSVAKRGRKYYLGLATITQDVDDFLKSPYGVPMITNSSIQILLKQSPTAIDHIQETFNLTDEEKYLLIEAQVGEGIFFAGSKHVAIKVIASYTEDQIITSDPSQLLAIQREREAFEQGQQPK
jgi:conjugal transfer ATP-binding protein TraC